jgi:oxygen-dependent protoporphyrinogen oxidase
MTRRVAVIGGGMAGLAAAHRLLETSRRGTPVDVTLFEAGARAGGTIATEHTGGFLVEGGPDAFITDKPWALALCNRLGIRDRLVGTCEGDRRTRVVRGGRLHPLPEGFLMLAPTDLRSLAWSPLFSWPGKVRMALDLVLPRGRGGDESLASFVRRRLGREALDRAADPLVGGIYTADPERLSLAATMPRFLDVEREHRSLILGLRARAASPTERSAAGARYGLFASHARGMGALVDDLVERLPGVVRVHTPVSGLARQGAAWRFRAGGEATAADAVIVAAPAPAAAALLADLDPTLGRMLGAIDYATSATVTLGYDAPEVDAVLEGFGFVVPAIERRPLLACTFASRKFPGRAPAGHALVRAFVGGARRPEIVELDDDALVAAVRGELRALLGIASTPILVRIHRYRRAMPQYAVGHLDRVAAIDARVAALPGLALAGAAYRGVGIPDCVRSGEAAADTVLAAPLTTDARTATG